MTVALSQLGQNESSGSPSNGSDDWASLPPAWDFTPPDNDTAPGESEDTTPDDLPICPVCGKGIIRDPSWRRMHKYHDDCRPSAGKTSTTKTTRGAGKAEREADQIVSAFRSGLVKAALFIGMVDKFDGLVILVNIDSLCANLRGILIQYEGFRKECLKGEGGGSIFGLVVTGLFIAGPILANHGMLPGKASDMLMQIPFLMFKLSQKMKESEENLKDYMDDRFSEWHKTHPRGGGQFVQGETVKNAN